MIVKLEEYNEIDNSWTNLPVYNRVEFDERLDEQLDSGSVQTILPYSAMLADCTLVRLTISDGADERVETMLAFDSVEKRGESYYIHTLELVEPTRLLMGLIIDGCKVTQPIEGAKQTIGEVLDRLLTVAELRENPNYDGARFRLDDNALFQRICPEFCWESGTLLWECLCDIGNVINCIPRVYLERTIKKIRFDKVNEVTAEYEL